MNVSTPSPQGNAVGVATSKNKSSELDPDEWIALKEAANLMGLDRSHLARQCRTRLAGIGRAIKTRPTDGGAPKWYIARHHDSRLSQDAAHGPKGTTGLAPDLSTYTQRQRDDACTRIACVQSYRDARSSWPGSQAQWLPRLVAQLQNRHSRIKLSERSLRRWNREYKSPIDVVKLINKSGGNRRQEADPACWRAFKDLYLSESRHSIAWCWRQIDCYAQANDLAWLSLDACRNQLDKRISPEVQAKYRNPKGYRNGFQPYAEWKPDAYEAGERWDGDHCVLDLFCLHGEGAQAKIIRPWITAWMDWRTRKIVGWHLSEGPNSHTILCAFRGAMLDESNHGGPRITWIDNGKDYDSYVFHGMTKAERHKARRGRQNKKELGRLAKIDGGLRVDEDRTRFGVFNLLGIEAHFSLPYNPTGKGRLERWFGSLHDGFDKLFETYCGPTVVDRPEDLAKRCKDHPHIVPRFDTVLKELQTFIEEYNNTEAMRRGAEGYSLNHAMQALPHTQRKHPDPNVLRQCLGMWSRPISVTRNGVRICPGNVTYTYGRHTPELRALIRTGKKVHARYDPDDMREIEVYDANGRHLCSATCNERIGHGPAKHGDIRRLVNERKSRVKQWEKLRRTAIRDILPVGDAYAVEQVKKRTSQKPQIKIDLATVKVEPREVKLGAKPAKFDAVDYVRRLGGVPDSTDLAELTKSKPATEMQASIQDEGEEEGFLLGEQIDWPPAVEAEDEFDLFNTLQQEGGAA